MFLVSGKSNKSEFPWCDTIHCRSTALIRELSMNSVILDKESFINSLTQVEKLAYKTLLVGQVEKFFGPDHEFSIDTGGNDFVVKFNSIARLLRELTAHAEGIPENGIAFKGKLPWMTADLLVSLQRESEQELNASMDRTDHLLSCGGAIADRLAIDNKVIAFVSKFAGGAVRATGIASYMYYKTAGSGIKPHIDTEVFSLNLMLKLKHQPPHNGLPSTTIVFPASACPEKHHLPVGEAMLLHGSAVLHARTPVGVGEDITLLTIGFNYI
jgi:hypothetical protein